MNTVKAYEEIIDFIAAGTTPQNVIDFRPSEAAQARVEDLRGFTGTRKGRRTVLCRKIGT